MGVKNLWLFISRVGCLTFTISMLPTLCTNYKDFLTLVSVSKTLIEPGRGLESGKGCKVVGVGFLSLCNLFL